MDSVIRVSGVHFILFSSVLLMPEINLMPTSALTSGRCNDLPVSFDSLKLLLNTTVSTSYICSQCASRLARELPFSLVTLF